MGMASVLTVPMQNLPAIVKAGLKQIVESIINLEIALEKQRLELQEENQKEEEEVEDIESDESDKEIDEEEKENDEVDSNKLQQLSKDAAMYADEREDSENEDGSEYDSEIGEDDDFCSAVDEIDECVYFVETLKAIASRDLTYYQTLITSLPLSIQELYNQILQLPEKHRIDKEKEKEKQNNNNK